MRIREVSTIGLKGATPEGGWSEELKPDDVVHTLVTVHTDEGPVGYGSVFTSEALVRAALKSTTSSSRSSLRCGAEKSCWLAT